MKSTTTILAVAAAILARPAIAATTTASSTATATQGVEQPSSSPVSQQPVVQGCFSSYGDLVFNSSQLYNSRGLCGQDICQALDYDVAATTEGNKCYCGNSYPPKDTLVDDSYCNTPCTGYAQDACGGVGYWTVYNTGLELYDVPYANSSSSSSSSSSTSTSSSSSTKSSTVTTDAGGQTVVVTQTSSATGSSKSGSSNTAGIAAGTVVGVVAVAAGVGAVFFMLRRRRNREIEEEHRRNAAVNSFFSGKPPGSSGGYSGSDARLDPVMAQRRLSDGSIADNQDYSRKILRVTNA